jgi:hypothetical protein
MADPFAARLPGRPARAVLAAITPGVHGRNCPRREKHAAAAQARAHTAHRTPVPMLVLTGAEDFQVGRAVVRAVAVAMMHVQAAQVAQPQKMPRHQPVEGNLRVPLRPVERDVHVARGASPAGEPTPRGARLRASRCRSFF